MKSFAILTTPIVLRWPAPSSLEAVTRALFDLGDQFSADFLRPAGEAFALLNMWRVFKDPPSLFIGGVAHFRDGGGSIEMRGGPCVAGREVGRTRVVALLSGHTGSAGMG
jgi:hypothetical protein